MIWERKEGRWKGGNMDIFGMEEWKEEREKKRDWSKINI